jgi:hypothetical protein
MDLRKERFDEMYHQLPVEVKREAMNYIEYLIQKLNADSWDNLEEIDEPLNEEEKRQLSEPRRYLTAKEVKNEFKLHIDLP